MKRSDKMKKLKELEAHLFVDKSEHPVEVETVKRSLVPVGKRTATQRARLLLLAGVFNRAIDMARNAFASELDGFVRTEKCRQRFSLCLDCDRKNRCERYSSHLRLANKERFVNMARPRGMVGKFIVLWRNDKKVPARVIRVNPGKERVSYELLSGKDKGKRFSSEYDPNQTVRVYGVRELTLACLDT